MNIVYLLIFVIGSDGITSQSIPQANMNQCQINAKTFNTSHIMPNSYTSNTRTNKAYCIVGIK